MMYQEVSLDEQRYQNTFPQNDMHHTIIGERYENNRCITKWYTDNLATFFAWLEHEPHPVLAFWGVPEVFESIPDTNARLIFVHTRRSPFKNICPNTLMQVYKGQVLQLTTNVKDPEFLRAPTYQIRNVSLGHTAMT